MKFNKNADFNCNNKKNNVSLIQCFKVVRVIVSNPYNESPVLDFKEYMKRYGKLHALIKGYIKIKPVPSFSRTKVYEKSKKKMLV